jgi:DNA polymerase-1
MTRFQDEVRSAMPATTLKQPTFTAPPTTIKRAAPQAAPDLFSNLVDETPAEEPATTTWKHDYRLVNDEVGFMSFLADLSKQTRFAIDLETTSLEPHSAQIVGAAICWKAGEAYYLAFRGPAGEKVLSEEQLARLKPILEDPKITKVNQNIKYDRQVFRALGIELAGVAGDPMVADYLLRAGERTHGLDVLSERYLNHRPIPIAELIGKGKSMLPMEQVPTERVSQYACEDADVAFRLCETLEPMLESQGFKRQGSGVRSQGSEPLTPDSCPLTPAFLYDDLEVPLIGVLADMEFAGIRLDVPLLNRMSGDMGRDLERLEREIHDLAGRPFNIGSVKQLREILFDEKGYKPSHRTTITGAASTDQETLEDLARQGYELPKKLLEHRKIAKLKSTYVDALPALVQPKTGRVHASFNQTVAATGRLSSSDPNLQNIPIRSELGGQIRQAFLPREGWLLVTADYSQIELRLLAQLSDDATLRKAFEEDQDIHSLVAAQIFDVDAAAVTAEQRRVAKTVNFGVIYGISAFGLSDRLEIPKEEGAAFIETFFKTHPRVLDYQDKLLAKCRENGYVATILGRRRAINGIRARSSYKGRNQPEREAINMEIQGSAADLIKVAMLNLHRQLREKKFQARMLLQIHDELVFETPPEEKDAVVTLIREEMAQALSDRINVPLGVDLGVGPNWLDVQ